MNPTPLPVRTLRTPPLGETPGCSVLWRSGEEGWSHPPLYLTSPLLLLCVNEEGTTVETPSGELVAQHDDKTVTPFNWIKEILNTLSSFSVGTERRMFTTPAFPLASVCAAYEFGRFFTPHEHCFPHAADSKMDDLLVAFHSTGFVRKKNQWAIVGRPPTQAAHWRDWQPTEEQCEWPQPPTFRDRVSTDKLRMLPATSFTSFEATPSLSRSDYGEAFNAVQEHLAAGDIYQANLTVRFDGVAPVSSERIFAAGIAAGGERYAGLFRGKGYYHFSFSPELLVKKWGRSIVTRPIKGTRPLLSDADAPRVAEELKYSAKDRAEHVMIVDLERNDLGKICEYGTVRVDSLMEPTVHPTVVHLESKVTGTLRPNIGLREIITAMFPGGSVTGAPKRRTLEIIGELENKPRGIYCGALGWVDHRGDCEFNLPIRTGTHYDDYTLHYYAGGGIVVDSEVESEWEELHQKTKFINDAIQTVMNI